MSAVQDNKFDAIYDYVVWNSTEKQHREWAESQSVASDTKISSKVLLSEALKRKMENSLLGSFMYHLNSSQSQSINIIKDKLDLVKFDRKLCNCSEQENLQDDIFSDIFDLITRTSEMVHDKIEMKDFMMCMNDLRLVASEITVVDNGLLQLSNLRLLNLALNKIAEIPGYHLSRSIIFLELYGNVISDIAPLTRGFPEQLLHLGLARNRLTDDSNLYLLGSLKNSKLMSLDLQENDIYNLKECLESVSGVHNLVALSLKGNPCATCHSYSTMVLTTLPELRYLDSIEVSLSDREFPKDVKPEPHTGTGTLLFYCYRLMAVPQTTQERTLEKHSYHVEVELSLLDPELKSMLSKKVLNENDFRNDVMKTDENSPTITSEKPEHNVKRKHKTAEKKVDEKDIQDNKHLKDDGKEEKLDGKINDQQDGHVNEVHITPETSHFKTKELPWSRVIEFPTPAINIDPYDNDLKLLRDTFWTKVKVRIIHTKITPSKSKKDKKKSGRERKTSSKKSLNAKDDKVEKKVLASFDVQLEQIDWFENSLDYVWSKVNGDMPPEATKAQDKLQDLVFDVGKKVGSVRKTVTEKNASTSGQQITAQSSINRGSNLDIPTELTCHLGFGLKRLDLKNWETKG